MQWVATPALTHGAAKGESDRGPAPGVKRAGRMSQLCAHVLRLAQVLRSRQGMVILSGFDCELYGELFGHWERHEKRALTIGRTAQGATYRTEVVWLNGTLCRRANGTFDRRSPQP